MIVDRIIIIRLKYQLLRWGSEGKSKSLFWLTYSREAKGGVWSARRTLLAASQSIHLYMMDGTKPFFKARRRIKKDLHPLQANITLSLLIVEFCYPPDTSFAKERHSSTSEIEVAAPSRIRTRLL